MVESQKNQAGLYIKACLAKRANQLADVNCVWYNKTVIFHFASYDP